MNDIFNITEKNIWNFRQNHPELVVNDLRSLGYGNEIQEVVRASMLARGVNKWLKVRRDLIAYKKKIKHEVKELMCSIPELKSNMTDKFCDFNNASVLQVHEYHKARQEYLVAKELLKYKQKVRADLKGLCMTDRLQIWEGKKLKDMNTITCSD